MWLSFFYIGGARKTPGEIEGIPLRGDISIRKKEELNESNNDCGLGCKNSKR